MWNDRKCRKSMFIPNRACFQHNSFLKILWLQPEDSFNQYNFSIYSTILLWILIYPVGCNKEVSMSNWLCVLRWRSFEQYYPHSVDQRYIFIVWNFKFHFINVEGNSIFERSVTIIKYTINIFHFRLRQIVRRCYWRSSIITFFVNVINWRTWIYTHAQIVEGRMFFIEWYWNFHLLFELWIFEWKLTIFFWEIIYKNYWNGKKIMTNHGYSEI